MPRRKTTPVTEAETAPVEATAKRARRARTPTAPRPKTTRAPAARPRPKTAAPDEQALLPPLARIERAAARFEAGCESLSRSLHELPRPDDFQPLADHLYAFASTAPALLESLQEVPRAAEPIERSVRALEQLAETLHFTHESFNESLLRLPRAEDYEPLVAPLGEFARVAPALVEALADVSRVARPLGAALQELEGVSRSLRATEERLVHALRAPVPTTDGRAAGVGPSPAAATPAAAAVAQAAASMRAARQAILDALGSLPHEPAYAALAGQLRELATVSPSLMEWLRQTPSLSAPLASSVTSLREAAAALEQGLALLEP